MEGTGGILTRTFLGSSVLQWLFALVAILMASVLSKVVSSLLRGRMTRWTERTKTRIDDLVIKAFPKPLAFLIFVVGIYVAIRILSLPPKSEKILHEAFKILIAVSITYFAIKLVDILAGLIKPVIEETPSKLDDQLVPVIGRTLKIAVGAVAALVIVENFGYDIKSLLAGLGIGGIAFAFAARDTVANFFGSVTIFADRPFQVGERVQVDGFDGPVESIGMRSTRIRTLDGTLVVIPNNRMANATIHNISARPNIKNMTTIGLTYDTGREKMKRALEILKEITEEREDLEELKLIRFQEFGPHSLNILFIYWYKGTSYLDYLGVNEQINLEIMRRFEEASIEMAFPTQTIHLKEGEGISSPGQ